MTTHQRRMLSIQPVAERGGSDHALMRMCRELSRQGWECHVVFPEPSPLAAEFAAVGVTAHVVPMRRLTRSGGAGYWEGYAALWPISILRLLNLCRTVRPDVIHSNSLHSWYGWAVAWLRRTPHIWHVREIVVQSALALRVERRLSRRFAWRVVAVSEPAAAQLSGPNVMVIHDALGPEDGFSPERAGQFRARVGITDEAVLVGAAGRFDTWKGFDVLLEAFPEIRRHRPDLELVVAGGPVQGKEAYAAGLEALAAQTEGVHWIGSRSDMPEFMADLDVFVLASTEPEPFASVSVEAMASGVPVVATDHGGSPEMLSEGPEGSGGLFAPRDPMALAEAVVAMAPEHPSSVARRRARTPTYIGDASSFVRLFDEALG